MNTPEYDATVEEYHRAQFALVEAQTTARQDPKLATQPLDVRDAAVFQATKDEALRMSNATIALEKAKAVREDRWIASHEALAFLRGSWSETKS